MREFEKLNCIYNCLQDDESKALFSLMLKRVMSYSEIDYMEELASFCKSPVVEERLQNKISNSDGIIIYGCGVDGRLSNIALKCCGYSAKCFGDTHNYGFKIDGVDVLEIEEALKKYPNHLVCICSRKYGMEMYRNLIVHGIEEDRIYVPKYGIIYGSAWRKQYMDVLDAPTDGIIIDAGAFDGSTAVQFMNWTCDKYDRIICFEPELKQALKISDRQVKENWRNVDVIAKGLWDKSETLSFCSSNAGSSIVTNGDLKVECCSIDEIVKGKVSFIKMDIEGAELKALMGAKNTIMHDRPKMAICIYHKKSDILDIGSYLLSLNPDYKMWIRHYSTFRWETVLYVE